MKRKLIVIAAVVAAFIAGACLDVRVRAPRALAGYRVTASDPMATFDPGVLEVQVATFCKNNSITTDAAYQTAVNGIAAGSALELAAVKAIMRSITLVP